MLYPLLLAPLLQARVWGGRDLERLYQKPLPPGVPIGESWEIADRPGASSVVANGPLAGRDLRWLMTNHAGELLGAAVASPGRFPLLVKILDARQVLSVQVHPPAAVAAQLGGEPKTEMWFVTQAAPGAQLLAGLRAGVDRAAFARKLADGTVGECLHTIPVAAGDALFLPSGRVHALGEGLVIFEIQQNSDTTYRVFDWNRPGPDGKPRALHVQPAMTSIDFGDFAPGLVKAPWERRGGGRVRKLVEDPLFSVREWQWPAGYGERLAAPSRPRIIGVATGRLRLDHAASGVAVVLSAGHFCLLPASLEGVNLAAQTATRCLIAVPGLAGCLGGRHREMDESGF